jgi:hypothetical protein
MTGINLYAENIAANVAITSQTQSYTFTTAISQYQLINSFVPISLTPSQNCLEFINVNLSGFRFRHTTLFGEDIGNLTLEFFSSGGLPGTTMATFAEGGTITFASSIVFSGAINIGNINISGNTISSTNTNGNILLEPNGTGVVTIGTPPTIPLLPTGTVILDIAGPVRETRILGSGVSVPVFVPYTPTVGAGATGNTTGGEVGGIITLITGATGVLGFGKLGTVTLQTAMPITNFSIVLTPCTGQSANLVVWVIATSNITFDFYCGIGLNASATYSWNYQIAGFY